MSESRRKVIMTWCLVLDTKGTEAYTAGTCAGNSSGKCKSATVYSPQASILHWPWIQHARGWGLIFFSFSCLPVLFKVGGLTSWLKCCWDLVLQTSRAASGKWREALCLNKYNWVLVNTCTCMQLCFLTRLLCFSHWCQAVQEEGVGESDGAVRVQRLCLSDGDDRPSQTAQLHNRRSEALINSFTHSCIDMFFVGG